MREREDGIRSGRGGDGYLWRKGRGRSCVSEERKGKVFVKGKMSVWESGSERREEK